MSVRFFVLRYSSCARQGDVRLLVLLTLGADAPVVTIRTGRLAASRKTPARLTMYGVNLHQRLHRSVAMTGALCPHMVPGAFSTLFGASKRVRPPRMRAPRGKPRQDKGTVLLSSNRHKRRPRSAPQVRRPKRFGPMAQTLDAGRIHSARAGKITPTLKIKRDTQRCLSLFW